MASPESQPQPRSPERHNSVAEAAGERIKSIENSSGETLKFNEAAQEKTIEHARRQAEIEAAFAQEQGNESRGGGEPTAAPVKKSTTRSAKQKEYTKTLKSMQSQMSAPAKAFSKTIHNPVVEKASEVAGATVARPNAILAGSFTAFIAVLGVYLYAQYIGFRLSGFETILAFIIGWAIGMALDFIRVAFSRRKQL